MIRKFNPNIDIEDVSKIWLDTNIKTHDFIPTKYWQDNSEIVKEMFLQAEIYVYENENTNKIQGFIGLSDNYIEGIFVCSENQSKGIGKQLLEFVKKDKKELKLNVYEKNIRAVEFYKREGFKIYNEDIDVDTGEKEYLMIWK